MSRKHILKHSIVIFVLLGSFTSLVFVLFLGIDNLSNVRYFSSTSIYVVIIMYIFAIIFGSVLSLPAAFINYFLSNYSFKNNHHEYFFQSRFLTFIYGFLNGLVITIILSIFIMVRELKFELELEAFISLPCVVSSLCFCFYRRKKYLTKT